MLHKFSGLSVLLLLLGATLPIHGDEKLKGIACRSVHLGYGAPKGRAFYNEIAVEHSAPGTYFMVNGWNRGYFGIQELGDGKKVVLFSVWDSDDNDPQAQKEAERVKVLHQDPEVRVKRFGGEGSGGQSFFDYDWKVGETYRFLVTGQPDGRRTVYSGYFYIPEQKAWKHLVSFSTVSGGEPLGGYYSFVEDFKRDRVSTTHLRQARFGNTWVQGIDKKWHAIREARFTGDANPVLNINAEPAEEMFRLGTGGALENTGVKLREAVKLGPAREPQPAQPEGLPQESM